MPSDDSINVRKPEARPDDPWLLRNIKFVLSEAGKVTLNVVLLGIVGALLYVGAWGYANQVDSTNKAFVNITERINAAHKEARDDFKKELEVRDKVGDTVMGFMKEEQKTSRETIGLLQQQHNTTKELLQEIRGQRVDIKAIKGKGE